MSNSAKQSQPVSLTRRKKRVNHQGWWGIARYASVTTLLGVAVTTLIVWLLAGAAAAGSALFGGIGVWLLSVITIVTIAWVWSRARHAAIPVAMGTFILKLIIFGAILRFVPAPEWIETAPAGLSALIAIVLWQTSEILVFMQTRHQIYDD